jgi:hypothetical protein
MVDPEHVRFVEDPARDVVQLARARQIVADRLLDHDRAPGPEARLADPLDDRREGRRSSSGAETWQSSCANACQRPSSGR